MEALALDIGAQVHRAEQIRGLPGKVGLAAAGIAVGDQDGWPAWRSKPAGKGQVGQRFVAGRISGARQRGLRGAQQEH